MIADAKHNEHGSGTTSMRYEKISAAKPAAPHIETDLSEEAMLQHHADSALAAMRDLLAKIQGDMKHAADPREWAERYPWATVAAAAAAGFAAAATIVPHKHAPSTSSEPGNAGERERMEAYVRDAARRAAAETTGAALPPPPPQQSVWTPLVELAKSAAAKYILSAAQTGIAAFAAAHAVQKMSEESTEETECTSDDGRSSPNIASP